MPGAAVKLTETEAADRRVGEATAAHQFALAAFQAAKGKVTAMKSARRAARRARRRREPGALARYDRVARDLPAAVAAKRSARRELRDARTELAAAGRAKADAVTGMARMPGGHY
jgi:hypothetical protein